AVIVEMCPGAAAGSEQLLAQRVVDYGVLETAAHLTGNRNGEYRKAVQEVGGAIERIDDPECVVLTRAPTLLGKKGVLRIVAGDAGDDLLLGRAIHFGHEVVTSLGGDGDRVEAIHAAHDEFAGAPRGTHGNVEERLHGRPSS